MNPVDRDTLLRRVAPDVKLGRNVRMYAFVNLYGCEVGDDTSIGTFVEIQKGVRIGARCKIQSHTFICEGVTIEDEVFVGHNVNFINDLYPRATNEDGSRQGRPTGRWSPPSCGGVPLSAQVRSCWVASPLGREQWSEPGRW